MKKQNYTNYIEEETVDTALADKPLAECCKTFFCKLPALLHQMGVTPYSYHTADETNSYYRKNRHQHYKATFYWTTTIFAIAGLGFYGAYGFTNSAVKEDQFLSAIHDFSHITSVLLTFAGMAIALGVISGLIHFIVKKMAEKCCGAKDFSEKTLNDVELETSSGSKIQVGAEEKKNEDSLLVDDQDNKTYDGTGVLGTDRGGRTYIRVGKYSLLNAVYPPTPGKTIAWVTVLGIIGITIACSVKPEFFKEIKDSGYDHVGSVATVSALSGMIIGGGATFFHWLGAKVTECCTAEDKFIADQFDEKTNIIDF